MGGGWCFPILSSPLKHALFLEPHNAIHPRSTLFQRPDVASTVTAIRVSLAHAYYGTPTYAIPFTMTLPKAFHTPLPTMDVSVHQVSVLCLLTSAILRLTTENITPDAHRLRTLHQLGCIHGQPRQRMAATNTRYPSPLSHIALNPLSR